MSIDTKAIKLLIKDKLIDIDILRDLKENFTVKFTDDGTCEISLEGTVLTNMKYDFDIDFSHWVDQGVSYSNIIRNVYLGMEEYKNIM